MLDALIFLLIGANIGYVLSIAKDVWEERHEID